MKQERVKELFTKYPHKQISFEGYCHDCGAGVEVIFTVEDDGRVVKDGGVIYETQERNGLEYFLKCDACFAENSRLENFRECEIFSRIVGYLRPINQWNLGKVAEYNKRLNFDIGRVAEYNKRLNFDIGCKV